MIYVDLNCVRAKVADSIEDSIFTSGYDCMNSHTALLNLNALEETKYKNEESLSYHQKKELKIQKKIIKKSSWLAPLATNKVKSEPENATLKEVNLLPTTTPFLSFTVEKYLELLDLTGRTYHKNKPGVIADKFAPILESMGFQQKHWML